MKNLEPSVGESCAKQPVKARRRVVEPLQKRAHLAFKTRARRRLVMHTLTTNGSGDDLHRGIAPQGTDADFGQPRTTGWKECGLPGIQSLEGQGLIVALSRIEKNFDQPIDRARRGWQTCRRQAEATREGAA
jgi:hypothetical protein